MTPLTIKRLLCAFGAVTVPAWLQALAPPLAVPVLFVLGLIGFILSLFEDATLRKLLRHSYTSYCWLALLGLLVLSLAQPLEPTYFAHPRAGEVILQPEAPGLLPGTLDRPATIGQLAVFIGVFSLAATVASLAQDVGTRRLLALLLAGHAALLSLVGIYFALNGAGNVLGMEGQNYHPRFFGPFHYHNDYVGYAVCTLGICCGLALDGARIRVQALLWISAGLGLVLLLGLPLTRSRTALLALVPLLILFSINYWRHCRALGTLFPWKSAMYSAMALFLVAGLGLTVGFEQVSERWQSTLAQVAEAREGELLPVRIPIIRSSWNMVEQSPLFGWGAGSWHTALPMFAEPALYDQRYAHQTADYGKLFWPDDGHNDLLHYAAELGIAGLLLLLAPLAICLLAALKQCADLLNVGILASLLTVLLIGFWDSPLTNPVTLAAFAATAACCKGTRRESGDGQSL